jgi:methionine--tRNA ligase beta chain
MITYDDFAKLEIKIGKVVSVEKVPEADRLLKLVFDFGQEQRQIISAIAPYFPNPSVLVGQQMPVLTNLEPKVLRGHESQGMILSIALDDNVVMLNPAQNVPDGTIVR